MGPGDLTSALAALPRPADPRLLVGLDTFDDAGVFAVSDDVALVQTVDFFAPIVDDPYSFGQIAAANALSDVYAMGGEPLTALNIVGFPTDSLPMAVLAEILRGADEKIREAGAVVVGGHSVIDDEVKFGLAVTGRVDPRTMLTNAAAKAGERLVLTKPIGTGLLATAAKRGDLAASDERVLIDAMTTLNRRASRAALDVGARCATDISGFGLLGHASHVARASGVTLVIRAAAVPVLPGARDAVARGVRTGGAERNREYLEPLVDWGGATDADRALLVDPQTSGGLLVSLPASRVAEYLSAVPGAAEIGEVVAPRKRGLTVV
ncbi:MAG: selenide, water dikinase SelD [Gemmatimonadota bacterium]|nr:selenide, water dikinase SelD [Gemmatimonadota bacterium]